MKAAVSAESAEFMRRVGGKEVIVRCHPALERQASWLLGLIEDLNHEGKSIWNGERIQVGWSIVTLLQQGERWVTHEPDFSGDPFHNTRDEVTTSLSVQAQQNDVIKRVGADPFEVSFQDQILVGEGCLDMHDVYLERVAQPNKAHSGWYLGPVNGDVETRQSLYVFELLNSRPTLLQVLALPPGYLAVFEGDRIKAVLNPAEEDVWTRH